LDVGTTSQAHRIIGNSFLSFGLLIMVFYHVKVNRVLSLVFISWILYQGCLAAINTCVPTITISIPSSQLNLVDIVTNKNAQVNCTGAFSGLNFINGSCLYYQQKFKLLWSNQSNTLSCSQRISDVLNSDGTVAFGFIDSIAYLYGSTEERLGFNGDGSLSLYSDPDTQIDYVNYYNNILFLLTVTNNSTSDYCNFIFGCTDCPSTFLSNNTCVISQVLDGTHSDPSCLSLQNCMNPNRTNGTRVCRTTQCSVACNGSGLFNECGYCSDASCYQNTCNCTGNECLNRIISTGIKLEIIYSLIVLIFVSILLI